MIAALAVAALLALPQAEQAADVRWGGTRCQTTPRVYRADLPGTALGRATYSYWVDTPRLYDDCEVELDPRAYRLPYPKFCAVIVHEFGHLAGRHHSRNPRSVMYPKLTHIPRVCRGRS